MTITKTKDRIAVMGCYDEESKQYVVSHGVNMETFQNVVLPTENYKTFVMQHCYKCPDTLEYILK